MEQALFISKIESLDRVTQKYTRLYYGVEFCERLAPSRQDIEHVLQFVSERKMDFTLVTPFLTNEGMNNHQLLIGRILDREPRAEIVVNDWGLLHWLNQNYSNVNLVLGRLLTKQKRGPRIVRLKGRVPDAMIDHFQRCNVDSPILTEFLIQNMVKRIELDNLLQGIRRPPQCLKGSLYVPFAYVTTTRLCLFNSCEDKAPRPLRAIDRCDKECQKQALRLRHSTMPVDLLLRGNTQFFRHDCLPDNLTDLNIDRIVHEPELPA